MGLFDVIHFPKPISCVVCQAQITSTQTKAFDPLQNDFYIGYCVGHAEEIRIVREALYCDACHAIDQQFVYLVVYRGILVDITTDLAAAQAQLGSFSFEKLILWYHDLSAQRDEERGQLDALTGFLHDVLRWFEGKYDQMLPEEQEKNRFFFLHNSSILETAGDPLAAIRAYLEQMTQQEAEAEGATGGAPGI
jgi:hypothetical protein